MAIDVCHVNFCTILWEDPAHHNAPHYYYKLSVSIIIQTTNEIAISLPSDKRGRRQSRDTLTSSLNYA